MGEPAHYYRYAFFAVLATGVLVRILVAAFVGYFNNDNHLAVLEHVSRHWTPPNAAQLNQAYHPPLYYFLAAPFFLAGSLPAVQGLSLLLSIATLAVIALLLRHLAWISEPVKVWCLALTALHPQFVLFGLFISNDTLAIFLGAMIFYQCSRLLSARSTSNVAVLGMYLGLGLLTKAGFLAFAFPLALFLLLQDYGLPQQQRFARLAGFIAIAAAVGCYKYVENFLLFGHPAVSNLDFATWTSEQRPTWTGPGSLFDFNILKLVQYPVISSSTAHSYPLMIYGSFWYSFVPESIFHGNLLEPFNRIGSLIYLAALWPTALLAVGAARIVVGAFRTVSLTSAYPIAASPTRAIFEGTAVLTLLLNLLLVVAIGWHYDVWSVFQGRLLFPAYVAVLITLNAGLDWTKSSRLKINLSRCTLGLLLVLFLTYFATEIWLASTYPTNPLSMDHMPYKIDMNVR